MTKLSHKGNVNNGKTLITAQLMQQWKHLLDTECAIHKVTLITNNYLVRFFIFCCFVSLKAYSFVIVNVEIPIELLNIWSI